MNEVSIEKLRTVLYRYCRSITQTAWDAEDLVQETCLKALPLMKGSQSHANPTAYLLRIAKNLSVDQARRRRIAKQAQDQIISALNSANDDLIEMEGALKLLMEHLSPLQRVVWLLREVFELRGTEIAEQLRTSEGAVKAALHRARASLRQHKDRLLDELDDHSGEGTRFVQDDLLPAYSAAIRGMNLKAMLVLARIELNESLVGREEAYAYAVRKVHVVHANAAGTTQAVMNAFAA